MLLVSFMVEREEGREKREKGREEGKGKGKREKRNLSDFSQFSHF